MNITNVPIGKNPPEHINVIIEVPMGSDPVKYEMDKESGAIFVDRFIGTSMSYPCNYGFIPHTLSDDGDPVDCLVISQFPVIPGAVIACRPIGVLLMEDESGKDEKILCVPVEKLDPSYKDLTSYEDLPEAFINRITHFFEHYKDLESGKWVKVTGWDGVAKSCQLIDEAIKRLNSKAA